MFDKFLKRIAEKIENHLSEKEKYSSYKNKADRKSLPKIEFVNKNVIREFFKGDYNKETNWKKSNGECPLIVYIYEDYATLVGLVPGKFSTTIASGNINLLMRFIKDKFEPTSLEIRLGIVYKNIWTGVDILGDEFLNNHYCFDVKVKDNKNVS